VCNSFLPLLGGFAQVAPELVCHLFYLGCRHVVPAIQPFARHRRLRYVAKARIPARPMLHIHVVACSWVVSGHIASTWSRAFVVGRRSFAYAERHGFGLDVTSGYFCSACVSSLPDPPVQSIRKSSRLSGRSIRQRCQGAYARRLSYVVCVIHVLSARRVAADLRSGGSTWHSSLH
jgi:hypothetical protein